MPYGNVNARMPLPVGGGGTAASPVGALMQQLLRWKAQGQQQGGQQPPPEFERGMADMLGLSREQGNPIVGRPAPDQMGAPPPQQQQNGGDSGGMGSMGGMMNPLASVTGPFLADRFMAPFKNQGRNPLLGIMGKNPVANPLLGMLGKNPLESWLGGGVDRSPAMGFDLLSELRRATIAQPFLI